MKFEQEQLSQKLIEELLPILIPHSEEVELDKDIPLDVAWSKYSFLQENNAMVLYTARNDEGVLVGYASYFVNPNLHYQSSLQATQDAIYIDKECRGFGRAFIDWCDSQLRNMGVQKVYQNTKAVHDFGPMLATLGYRAEDIIYSRRLDLSEVS